MRFVLRADMDRLRSSMSFCVSSSVHGVLLLWLAVAAANTPREVRRNLYDQEIRPYEKQIVWYNLREKLPDIKPAPAASRPQRPRAQRKFHQTLVSGPKDDARPPQMILTDSPPVELPKPLPLPNVVAEAAPAPPPPPRIFMPPPDSPPVEAPPPSLTESPNAEATTPPPVSPLDPAAPRPRPLPFQPPLEKKPLTADPPPALPEAPRVAAAAGLVPAPLGAAASRPQPLPFHAPPPLARPRTAATLTLPESPGVTDPQPPAPSAPLGSSISRPQPRPFQLPPPLPAAAPRTALLLPDAPANPASAPSVPSSAPRIPRAFSAPAAKGHPREPAPAIANAAPAVTNPDAVGTESFAIASLDPAKFTEIPAPPPSHEAGFSGAPDVRPGTAEGASNEKASLVVPRLTAGGVRDSRPTLAPAPDAAVRSRLMAELHDPLLPRLPAPSGPDAARALRVSSSPDPRMEGREVYTMAIQMPNVTSYSGSWMVWFAERIPDPGAPPADIRPPMPRHKVDPAYVRSAVDERIQGIVRLAAVIGKDGHVDQIEILSGIDTRLDSSAQAALAKWLFEPALRDGTPIDVDAVFEVPFHLAPKPTR